MFAAIHGFPVLMPYVLIFGIVTGWLRERTGSTAAGFVAHVLNNAVLVTATFLFTGWQISPRHRPPNHPHKEM